MERQTDTDRQKRSHEIAHTANTCKKQQTYIHDHKVESYIKSTVHISFL